MEHQWDEQLDAGLPGYYLVRQGHRWGIWSEEKGLIQPCNWFEIQPYRDGFFVVIGSGWGMVDAEGHFLHGRPWERSCWEGYGQFSDGSFVNGYATIAENDRLGYIDYKGNMVSPCIWDYAGSFDKEGHPALVFRCDGNYEYAPGEWGGTREYSYFCYYEDIPEYKLHPDDEELYCPHGYFYLTPDGNVMTPHGIVPVPKETDDIDAILGRGWLEAEPFQNGSAYVKTDDSDFYFIGWNCGPNPYTLKTEKMYKEQVYLPDGRHYNGYQLVWAEPDDAGNCFRILDRNGNSVSPYRWSHVEDMFELDKGPIRVYRRQWKNAEADGEPDEDGGYYFPGNDPSFMQDPVTGLSFHRGYYFLCADGEVLTMSGPVKSEEESELPDGWEWTEVFLPFLPKKYEYHTFWFPPENNPYRHQASILVNGHDIIVDEYGIFFLEAHIGTPQEVWFDAMVPIPSEIHHHHLMIRQDGIKPPSQKWGILHKRNEILTPCRWEEIRYTEHHIYVRDNGLWGILDPETGKLIEPCQQETIGD